MTNLLFSHYENIYVAAHLYNFYSSYNYNTLSHSHFVSNLLDQSYEKIQNQVDAYLQASGFWNFYTDKSCNTRKDKIISFIAQIPESCKKIFISIPNLMVLKL